MTKVTKGVKDQALAKLLEQAHLLSDFEKSCIIDSLWEYVLYGYMETPGANRQPYQRGSKLPRGAVDVFKDFLVANGEDRETADASMEDGWEEMVYTVGM